MKPIAAPVILCLMVLHINVSAQQAKDSISLLKDMVTKQDDSLIVDKSSSSAIKKSYFQAGLNYESNNVYLGRKDSSILPYLTPALSYYHKSGFYMTSSFGFLVSGPDSRLDEVTVEGGYNFSSGDYDGIFTASKFFYNAQSSNVHAEVSGSVAYENSYDFGWVKPGFTTTLNFGKKTDFAAAFSIEHDFFAFEDALQISPTIVANASTQNYYNQYYKNRRYSVNRNGKIVNRQIKLSGEVLDAAAFKILDYELSLPVTYSSGKCIFIFTPTFAIPVHPAIVNVNYLLTNGTTITRTHTEQIGNSLYWNFEFQFNF